MHFSAGLPGADVPVGLPWHALALARLCLSCDLAPCPRPRFLLPGLPRGGRALRRWKNPVRGAAWGPGVLGERRSVGLGGASAPQGAPPPSGEGAEGKTRLGPTVGTCPRLVSAGAWPWVPDPHLDTGRPGRASGGGTGWEGAGGAPTAGRGKREQPLWSVPKRGQGAAAGADTEDFPNCVAQVPSERRLTAVGATSLSAGQRLARASRKLVWHQAGAAATLTS